MSACRLPEQFSGSEGHLAGQLTTVPLGSPAIEAKGSRSMEAEGRGTRESRWAESHLSGLSKVQRMGQIRWKRSWAETTWRT